MVSATIVNRLDQEHGFSLPGSTSPLVIAPGETRYFSFALPRTPGSVAIGCQLHGNGHVPATITLTPAAQ
jgi:hypothetical protein